MADIVETALKKMKPRAKPIIRVTKDNGLSSGSTLLNLALTGKARYGFVKGHYFFVVGDSMSGKTWLAMTCLAEAALNPVFAKHRFILDSPENGSLMDVTYFFGKDVQRRLKEPPNGISWTTDEFYFNVDDALDSGPCIYILDSMDSLDAQADVDKFQSNKKARKDQKEEKGSFGMAKAKANSENLRKVFKKLKRTGSILIIISQTRDKVQTFGFGPTKTRAGGRSLRFYADCEFWSTIKKRIKKEVMGSNEQQGIVTALQVHKSRFTGRERTVDVSLFNSYGIDDVGSCIDWLLERGHWKKKKGGIVVATELDVRLTRTALISHIVEDGLEAELGDVVSEVWELMEEQLRLKRKRRYE